MEWFFWLFAVALGALAGSFLNVVIYRGPSLWGLLDSEPRDRGTLLFPGSYCPPCREPIPFWRLVPIVSFVLQKGRCARCKTRISWRYPLVEAAAILIAVSAYALFEWPVHVLFAALFGWTLLGLAVIDWETGYLPDWLTAPLIVAGVAVNAFAPDFMPGVSWRDAVIGAAIGYLTFRLIAFAFYRLRKIEGLGQGDAKLLAALGAWCGWTGLPLIVFGASIATLGGAAAVRLVGRPMGRDSEIPFGPGLCAAGWVWLLFVATMSPFP
jgi:leader peptidase (prepilin peptidase)/N-methyltransferase